MSDSRPAHRRIDVRRLARRVAPRVAVVPLVALAIAALTGIGLERGLSAIVAFAGAAALALLPAFGLSSRLDAGPVARVAAHGLWCAAILVALPAYFPGERTAATARGLEAATAFAGERVSHRVGRIGAGLVSLLGDDPSPDEEVRVAVAPVTSEARAPRPAPAPAASLQAERRGHAVVHLPYEGDQTSLRVRVDVDGPVFGEQVEMIFDTGATFTTLDHATLDRLGLAVDRDAPWISLHTANGVIQAPLVLVDAVWVGDQPIEWVTVAVCDSCVNPPSVGLLGLNVTQRFRVSLDHDRHRIELAPRRLGRNRALDVRQWLRIRSVATRRPEGAVDVRLEAANRSHRPVAEAVVDLTCGDQTVAVQIDDIPARSDRATEITLPRGTDCSDQQIEVSRAEWVLDRF